MLYVDYLKNKRGYQEDGRLLLLERKHACLFYKPGKGKTYPCVEALNDVRMAKGGTCNTLILSTADAIKNMWQAEIEPQNILPPNTVMMSFNMAIQDARKLQLMKIKWDVIIIDECHKIKSHNSKISKLVYSLSKKAEYVWGLTGTPRGNNDVDIFCQLHNMRISDWGDITYSQFVETCCDIDMKFFSGQCIKVPIGINHRYKAGWERNIAMYTSRVGYDEDDNMPKLDVNVVNIDYIATKQYLDAEDGLIKIGDYESTMTKLTAITKMHQAVNGFLYVPDEDGNNKIYRFEHNKKLDYLHENVRTNNVIVYRFQADLEDIQEQLDKDGFTYTENVEDFKAGKCDILLLQCSRCESFNLQTCNRIIFYTLDYSYIKYNQMIHRVWRMGQTQDVEIVILNFKDTVESNIWKAVQNKEKLAELFISIKYIKDNV